ncbi:hypothetical protein D1872_325290 [compost metagenome]
MRDAVNKRLFTGNECINIIRHLVEGDAQPFKAGGAVEMYTFRQMPLAKALRGSLQPQHILPVRTHPDKHRKGQRNGDKGHQRHVQQPHLV